MIAETISHNAPLAIKAIGTACMDSADFREGGEAFMEKRKPKFRET